MKHYSQHHLKVAPTEPEHLVRKAELDALAERFEHIGPAVFSPVFQSEGMFSDDTVESPFTKPIDETAIMLDGTETRFPDSQNGEFMSENTALSDETESPSTFPLDEIVTANDEACGIMPLIHLQQSHEPFTASDTLSPSLSGEKFMEQQTMQGEIEVVVEDRDGGVKSRQKITNAITDGFLRYSLYDMLSGGTLTSVLRSNTRTGYNLLSRTVPSALGIYAMDRDIDVRSETFLPPYVCADLNTLDPSVAFFNIGGNLTEDSQVMIPVDQRCYYDHNRRELVVEYVKNTGSGIVKSVCVGRSHLLKNQMYSVTQTETSVPNMWLSTSANYLIEHRANEGTSLWKSYSASAQYRFNLKNRTMETFTSSLLSSNITASSSVGGIVVGDHLFKVVKQSVSGSNITIRLNSIANFRTSSTSAYKDIVVPTQEGVTAATDTIPVMVYRMDTGKLEIFVTVSYGEHGNEFGFNIQKVTVSGLDDPATMTTETTDLGVLPYCISNFGTNAAQYLTGYFDGTHYYLPYTQSIDAAGAAHVIAESSFQNGIVISSDFQTVARIINMRSSTSGPNLIVRADTGLLQCQANDAKIPYIFMSQVVSGANLPEPSIKGLDDVLRIIYKYRLN